MIDSADFRRVLRKRFGLEPRHVDLLLLLCDGQGLCDAGKQMGLTESSARTYCKRLLDRMGAHCQHQAVALCYKAYLEIINPPVPIVAPFSADCASG